MKDRAIIDSDTDIYSKSSLNSKTASSLAILFMYVKGGTDGEKRRSDVDDHGPLI